MNELLRMVKTVVVICVGGVVIWFLSGHIQTILGWGILGVLALVAILGLILLAGGLLLGGGGRNNVNVIGNQGYTNVDVTYVLKGDRELLPPGTGEVVRSAPAHNRYGSAKRSKKTG